MSERLPDGNEERTDVPGGRQVPPPVWTVGHSTLPLEGFLARLAQHAVERVADVRRYPASRRHPHFDRETLAAALNGSGIEYRWFEDLGGRRSAAPRGASANAGLTALGFRAYADHMREDVFRRAFGDLLGWAAGGRTALLCAELLWWKCHRRLLSDLLVARGGAVWHIMDEEEARAHPLWDLAVVQGGGVTYPHRPTRSARPRSRPPREG